MALVNEFIWEMGVYVSIPAVEGKTANCHPYRHKPWQSVTGAIGALDRHLGSLTVRNYEFWLFSAGFGTAMALMGWQLWWQFGLYSLPLGGQKRGCF